MLFPFKSSFSRPLAWLGLLGVALMQAGCAHPVYVEPSVSVHSLIGHAQVYGHVGVPGPIYYAPPRVVYAPPPPPRVIYVPQVHGPQVHVPRAHPPAQIWGGGHDRGRRGQGYRQFREEEREHGRGGRGRHDPWRH
jgi:hypothetical protein